jgi:hypothetical protein
MATHYDFNGSTVTFGTLIARVRSINAPRKVPRVRVTSDDDTTEMYEPGKKDPELTVEVVGGVATVEGTKAALSVTMKDGTTAGTIAAAMLESVDTKGSLNGEITSTLKFCPSPAA